MKTSKMWSFGAFGLLLVCIFGIFVPTALACQSQSNSPTTPTTPASTPAITTPALTPTSVPAIPTLAPTMAPVVATQLPISTPTPAPSGTTSLQQYDQTPGAVRSAIKVAVNGQSIFVDQYKDVNYARFAFGGFANVTVTPTTSGAYSISPRVANIKSTRVGNVISFSLDKPQNLIMQFGATKLFLFADGLETNAPKLGTANVINVLNYVNDATGRTVQTANIQRAVDAAAAVRGTVYFPKGTYLSGTVNMRSNASVYLASGALLLGVNSANSYTSGAFVLFNKGVTNAKLYGRGVIDLRGKQLRSQGNAGRIKIIRSVQATNITVNDILIRDAGSWTVHFIASDTVNVNNLKLINDVTSTNGDGIDPDGSRNVTVNGAFIYTTDDCFAIKTSGTFGISQASNNILIKNNVCYTKKSALKIGTETKANLTNITFDNNAVVHADRVISLYMSDGATMQNIVYSNNSSEVVGGDAKQRLIDINVTNRNGLGYIRNVTVTNYTAFAQSPATSAITGTNGHITGITFKHMVVAGQVVTNATSARINISGAQVSFLP